MKEFRKKLILESWGAGQHGCGSAGDAGADVELEDSSGGAGAELDPVGGLLEKLICYPPKK